MSAKGLRRVAGEVRELSGLGLRRLAARVLRVGTTNGSAAAILDDRGSVLLVRSRHHPGWGLVGGFARRGEDPAAVMIREAMEEVGLDLTNRLDPWGVIAHPARHITTVFTARLDQTRPPITVTRPFEVAQAAWFAPSELPELAGVTAQLIPRERSALQVVDGRFVVGARP